MSLVATKINNQRRRSAPSELKRKIVQDSNFLGDILDQCTIKKKAKPSKRSRPSSPEPRAEGSKKIDEKPASTKPLEVKEGSENKSGPTKSAEDANGGHSKSSSSSSRRNSSAPFLKNRLEDVKIEQEDGDSFSTPDKKKQSAIERKYKRLSTEEALALLYKPKEKQKEDTNNSINKSTKKGNSAKVEPIKLKIVLPPKTPSTSPQKIQTPKKKKKSKKSRSSKRSPSLPKEDSNQIKPLDPSKNTIASHNNDLEQLFNQMNTFQEAPSFVHRPGNSCGKPVKQPIYPRSSKKAIKCDDSVDNDRQNGTKSKVSSNAINGMSLPKSTPQSSNLKSSNPTLNRGSKKCRDSFLQYKDNKLQTDNSSTSGINRVMEILPKSTLHPPSSQKPQHDATSQRSKKSCESVVHHKSTEPKTGHSSSDIHRVTNALPHTASRKSHHPSLNQRPKKTPIRESVVQYKENEAKVRGVSCDRKRMSEELYSKTRTKIPSIKHQSATKSGSQNDESIPSGRVSPLKTNSSENHDFCIPKTKRETKQDGSMPLAPTTQTFQKIAFVKASVPSPLTSDLIEPPVSQHKSISIIPKTETLSGSDSEDEAESFIIPRLETLPNLIGELPPTPRPEEDSSSDESSSSDDESSSYSSGSSSDSSSDSSSSSSDSE